MSYPHQKTEAPEDPYSTNEVVVASYCVLLCQSVQMLAPSNRVSITPAMHAWGWRGHQGVTGNSYCRAASYAPRSRHVDACKGMAPKENIHALIYGVSEPQAALG